MSGSKRETAKSPRPAPKPPTAKKVVAAKQAVTPDKPASAKKARTESGHSRPARDGKAAAPSSRPAKGASPKTAQSADPAFAVGKLHQVALLATNLEKSIAFYRDVLGLAYLDRFDPPGLAFFNLGGGTRLILSATSSKATLYFKVDDIDAAVRALAARGVFFLHKPSMIHRDDRGRLGRKGVEEWMAFFKDPSDNILALVAQR